MITHILALLAGFVAGLLVKFDAAQALIVSKKNELRDITGTPFPSDVPADIAALWSACLNG